ncbi:bifunctional [glutamine synthetase] adenylyltransferase/[glutamine synthetase]-adenylyl-L-tyrosine phosphorylase [Rhodobacteraceae bacterium RKSG542]|uniref:bifunctional [glutamine synthetase] adenylyltransferase/[glutamine synthetase]-adenylyl-L-tyrosine phosphorylase n=1 Tax=Pseudovibrio flavus TaxID=2529854 RepID=UPI0012BCAE24|nr:bifunctional [glutamine synthetase] adenylyltransferase/[glutamine synthetase]-adenylyl-L-tyrosine phosphorylase [Pseudovibrio flavus]MTI17037.1 bifunctional [glutamine synthetase] adenylyltransferase/[glutamine synthetase]-adenylyl-L-tyrosine phosphorylase [Pseudovibrio flavus]
MNRQSVDTPHVFTDCGPLLHNIAILPVITNPERASSFLDDMASRAERREVLERWNVAIAADAKVKPFLEGVFENSPFLREIAHRRPEYLLDALESSPAEALKNIIEGVLSNIPESEAELMTRLREAKQKVALTTAIADISGYWVLEDVTGAISNFADAALTACLRFCLQDLERRGKFKATDPTAPEKDAGYFILAMGKYGAFELNYSSDIDLIVFYEPDRCKLTDPSEVSVEFVRLTRRLVKLMNERTGDGYVFRTDLRLRPDPGATPLAISVPAALVYYESMGQNWERAALIKARPCAGDIEAGEQFLKEIRPFVWRKYLDYAAISDVHSIKRQIHAHKGFSRIRVAGHNVKLGRGGIREIEFFAQTQQLIAGGRNPALRNRRTLATLRDLVEHNWIDSKVERELETAYRYLRNVEHRIQMINDEQTHILPSDEDALARVYHLMGIKDRQDFADAIREQFQIVQRHYSGLFENEPDLTSTLGNLVFTGDDDDPGTVATLSSLGFKRPSEAIRIVRQWHYGRYPAVRTAKSRERLTELHPVLVDALAKTENADQALLTFDAFLSRLPAGIQLFGLLRSNPHLLNLLVTVMGVSPRMAEIVSRRVHVLDAVLEPAFFGDVPDQNEIYSALQTTLSQALHYEEVLDVARIFVQEQQFLLGLRLLTGSITPLQMGECLSFLAESVLEQVLGCVQSELEEAHGKVPGAKLALLAMGKLGGQEITCASDLDLILLYEVPEDAYQSDGRRPIAPTQYFARLTQRLVTALTAPTAEGVLYEVDFRLRPSGNSGPLATRFSSFLSYQKSEAWTWEHMALTRARVIACTDDAFKHELEAGISGVLTEKRDLAKLKDDVRDMRARIQKEKPTQTPWQIKQRPGGLVDIEFMAQFLQLAYGHEHTSILNQKTEKALLAARDAGVLSHSHTDVLVPALQLYEALMQILKLTLSENFNPEEAPKGLLDQLIAASGEPDFSRVVQRLEDHQSDVRAVFEDLIGPVEAVATDA